MPVSRKRSTTVSIPKELEIAGRTWAIKVVKRVDADDSWGETDKGRHVIKIRRGDPQEMFDTFVHEVFFHALLHSSGLVDALCIELRDNPRRDATDTWCKLEEMLATHATGHLIAVLKQLLKR